MKIYYGYADNELLIYEIYCLECTEDDISIYIERPNKYNPDILEFPRCILKGRLDQLEKTNYEDEIYTCISFDIEIVRAKISNEHKMIYDDLKEKMNKMERGIVTYNE